MYESHYTRAHHIPGRKYLNSDSDIRKMYSLYVGKFEEKNQSFVKEWIYRKVFNTEFNLNFYAPRKDMCQKCDLLKGKLEASSNEEENLHLRQSHDLHLQNVKRARNCLIEDQKKSKENPREYYGISFDLQKALPYPKLSVSLAYYKRNIFQEVASRILMHMEDITTQKHVIAYSNACSGQNRNIKIVLTWMKIARSLNNNGETIDKKFLVFGHSFLPNYRDFGLIEMKIKKANYLYNSKHYYELIEKYRRRNTFSVKRMSQPDFISTKPLEESTPRKVKNTAGESVS
ncbi:uncharacterized protein LOC124425043 [Vespa crabro]|uniref:uncharacterized protein LOC124425043 n=1 Tax=Vespa crabro TaxID=7445 RepID=UPI001F00F8D8|nr:uncharacterized protein LOC124425043 [Vespa crabro]